jgi:hypothetical protein
MTSDNSEPGSSPDTDGTETETEDVDDVVDETEAETDEDEPVNLTELDPGEIDPEDLENQDWTLGGEARGTIDFGGMTWLVEDPEDEEILNLIVGAATGEGEAADMDGSDRMYALCESAVIAPEISPERWRNMKSGERIGLTMRISEWAGIDQLMNEDFGDGQSPQSGN